MSSSGIRSLRLSGFRPSAWLAGLALCGLSAGCFQDPRTAENRTIDGSGNNTADTTMGRAGTRLMRLSTPAYEDGVSAPSGSDRPNPREISNAVNSQSESIPDARGLSAFVFQWGQFLDHDIDLTPEHEPAEPMNIAVPSGDPWFDPSATGQARIPLNRSVYDPATGTEPGNPRQQLNRITAWIDASCIYGADPERAAWLRQGVNGRMRMTPDGFLMFNDGTQDNAGGPGTDLFVSGDIRANEQLALTAMHTLFSMEHNRLADEIRLANPFWTDEEIYQRTRKFIGAFLQLITYNEFLPALLGQGALAPYTGYDPTVVGSIANEFSTAFYRLGHSMLPTTLLRLDEAGNEIPEGHLALRDAFFQPSRLTDEGGIAPLLRGLAAQPLQAIDLHLVDDIRNFLFGAPGSGGMDLASLNIQRGRDHGLPGYNQIRQELGYSPFGGFQELTANTAVASALAAVYGDINLVDPWIGALAEDHLPGASVGPMIMAVLKDQFERLRDADRFWYENDPAFTPAEVASIAATRLADIIRRNTGVTNIQDNVFFLP